MKKAPLIQRLGMYYAIVVSLVFNCYLRIYHYEFHMILMEKLNFLPEVFELQHLWRMGKFDGRNQNKNGRMVLY